MPISESLNFTFNGVSSTTMGIVNCHINNGMCEEVFIPNRNLLETKIRGKNTPYFQEIEQDPLEFNLTFAISNAFAKYAEGTLTFTGVPVAGQTVTIGSDVFEFCVASSESHIAVVLGATFTADNAVTMLANEINTHSTVVTAIANTDLDTVVVTAINDGTAANATITTETCTNASWGSATLTGGTTATGNLRDICKWLITDYYKPLVFESNPTHVYYAICVNASTLSHTADNGYFTANFRCSSPYAYSPMITTEEYDLSSNGVGGTTITLTNYGDMTIYPLITVTMCSGATCSIVNNSDSASTISFATIANDEILELDCENEDVTSSAEPTTYRFDNMTGNFTRLLMGTNSLQVYGNVKIYFQYEYIYYA